VARQLQRPQAGLNCGFYNFNARIIEMCFPRQYQKKSKSGRAHPNDHKPPKKIKYRPYER